MRTESELINELENRWGREEVRMKEVLSDGSFHGGDR
jgi:hypothetical protein